MSQQACVHFCLYLCCVAYFRRVLLIFQRSIKQKSKKKHALRVEGPSNGQQSMLSHIIIYFVVSNFMRNCVFLLPSGFSLNPPHERTVNKNRISLKHIFYYIIIFLLGSMSCDNESFLLYARTYIVTKELKPRPTNYV